MISRLAEALVASSLARPKRVIAVSLAVAAISLAFLATHFTVRTDLDALLSRDLPWRRTEAALEAAFVSQGDDLTLVVDGQTPEQADHIANQLTEKLAARSDLFAIAQRPDGGPFLEKEALLFLPLDEVKSTTAKLVDAQPFLGPLAADPSLRGVMGAIDTSLTGAESDPKRLERLAPILSGFDAQLADVEAGKTTMLSWRSLISGEAVTANDRRKLVALTPRIDYSQLAPAAPARAAIALAEHELGVAPGQSSGVQVKTTGSVAMESDELANLAEATGPIAAGSLALMLGILFWGVRSKAVIGAIALTVATGLMLTAALGLLLFERFTLISVAFMPLFVGLGIDFAIQFSVRYRAEAGLEPDHDLALLATGRSAGPGIGLAAAATGFGFFAFWPTPYKGVSELGVIAGLGMAAGAVLTLSVLPAWLKALKAGAAASESGLDGFGKLYRAAEARRNWLLPGAAALALIGLLLIPVLKLDFDPISLRSRKDPSVATFLELTRHPDLTPNRLQALTPNAEAAEGLARKLRGVKAVGAVYTVNSLIPADQAAKLALIGDAALILDTTLSPFDVAPPPSDAELRASLIHAAASLDAAARGTGPADRTAQSLSARLKRLADAAPARRAAAVLALTGSLTPALDQVRASLTAEPVTRATLPQELKREWISAKGEARVDITPAGDPADPANLRHFVADVRAVAPNVSGPPVAVIEAGRTILGAFIEAGLLSTAAICILLFVILRSLRDVALTIAPVLLTFILSLATLAVWRQPINLENLIALPLLLGIGVSFNIYSVIAWRDGAPLRTRASLSHAILFSALTTGASFTALALSAHPGTSSLGQLLLISLFWTVISALLVQPALLAFARSGSDQAAV